MEGGPFTLLVMLALLPVMICLWLVKLALRILATLLSIGLAVMRLRMQRRHSRSANEVLLRRGSHPVGLAAVALVAAGIFQQLHIVPDAVAALAHDPGAYWLAAVLLGAAAAYGLASFVTGMRRCSNPRDGSMTSAALKLVIGAAVAVYLWRLHPWSGGVASRLESTALEGGLFIAVWLGATGAVRILLLLPVGRARGEVEGDIADQEFDWDE